MLKKFTNIFWDSGTEDKPEKTESVKKVTTVDLANQQTLTQNTFIKSNDYPSVVEETVYDKEMMDGLATIIAENNQPGIDYFEFMQSVKNMKNIPTVDQKFQLVFSALQPNGLTVDKIVESANLYIQKLTQTKQSFEQALNEKSKNEVEKNIVDAENLQKDINALNQKLIELTEKQKELRNVADSNLIKINKNRASFDACYNKFVKEIEGDLEVVKRSLNQASVK